MSTDADEIELNANGVPELTPLGKRIELMRLERRMSKRVLAQRAGTSRQQLWRVMTGKSELTSSLCARLAEVLEIDSRQLREAAVHDGAPHLRAHMVSRGDGDGYARVLGGHIPLSDPTPFCQTLEEYLTSPHGLERTFETLPSGDDGRRLKRAVLNAIEDIADARAVKLPRAFFDLRRRVVNDER
jgi:transcriptional regulator with XRE-family HTH domain